MPGMAAGELLRLIGQTPLLSLARLEHEVPGVRLFAKAEWRNPGGSVKDRAAAAIIADAEASGRLRRLIKCPARGRGILYDMYHRFCLLIRVW